jgi:hypothetical protein
MKPYLIQLSGDLNLELARKLVRQIQPGRVGTGFSERALAELYGGLQLRQPVFLGLRTDKQATGVGVITLDGYAASHRAVDKLKTSGILPRRVQVRSCKYLNNVIEQDHRRIKQRVRPMLGFKRFETAAVMIAVLS